MKTLQNIPINRAITYLLCLTCLPLIGVIFLFFSQKSELETLYQTIEQIEQQAFLKEKKQALNVAVRHHFREADHFYIDKHLETLVFLEPEIEFLQRLVSDQNFADDDRIKKRLEFLTSSSNSLIFSEGVVQSSPQFQETIETLVHPVEVNSSDIQKILARIEGISIAEHTPGAYRPQLLITEFKLDKKHINDKNEVFSLNLKLVKREFL
jgi:hypothetical protein